MKYENPSVPHEVNVSRENVLVEFLRLIAGLGLCVLALSVALYFAGGWLARLVPFSTESSWVGDQVMGMEVLDQANPAYADSLRVQTYLQSLTARLADRMALPEGMQLHVHLAETDVPNAFATLGGHIVVTRGLYRRMPSENALAMVIAHEIGHIKARDPIAAVGGGASLALLTVAMGGDVTELAPQIARLVQLGYSRHAETRADTEALLGLRATYGHAGGSAAVFEVLHDYRSNHFGVDVPSLLSTHPADAERVQHMSEAAQDWGGAPALVPLEVMVEPRNTRR